MKKIYQLLHMSILFFGIPLKLNAQCSTPSITPYFEDFSSIASNNQLPVCWQASNLGNTCLTFTTPNKHSAFFDSPIGSNYFYTNAIQLAPGITYSAAIWHKVSASQVNWTDLSLLVGTSQSAAGLVPIVSTNGPISNTTYAPLSGTFTVNSFGVYYISVRGTSTASASNYLQWDELSITTPCDAGSGNNTPTLSIAGSATVCQGGPFSTYTVSGANMYTWSTGANTNTVMLQQAVPGILTLTVQGTNMFSGCTSSASLGVTVHAAPIVIASAAPASVCPGQISTLNAIGNSATFSWSTGDATPNSTVAPTQATTYTLTGTNATGCKTSTTVAVHVFSSPTVTASATHTNTCADDEIIFTAGGASTYTWIAPGGPITIFNPFIPAMVYNGTYTVIGKDVNGCSDTTNLLMIASPCAGLQSQSSSLSQVLVYPNPATGKFNLDIGNLKNPSLELSDLSGRTKEIPFSQGLNGKVEFNIEDMASGIYLLKIRSDQKPVVLKIIKE